MTIPVLHFSASDNDYHKYLLENYNILCKGYVKRIKFHKIYIGMCIFNVFLYTICAVSNHGWASIIWGICAPLWLISMYFTIKKLKRDKINLQTNRNLYEDELKIVDYSRYIKEQRTKKLKQIKKAN